MIKPIKQLLALSCMLTVLPLGAAEIAGVKIPDKIKPAASNNELVLNGAGIRRKFIFKVYVGALYLAEAARTEEAVLANDGAKRVLMHFLYDKVEKESLDDAWWDGFKANHTEQEMVGLNDRITQFVSLFGDSVEGDQIMFDFLPPETTRVTINDSEKGNIKGADFYRGLLKVWLGDSPVTTDLKNGMLGIEE